MCFFFFKQKTAYEMRISDWSSDVCSSDLDAALVHALPLGKATETIADLFMAGRPVIGICAAGILIRAVASRLADKHSEPPLIAVAADGSAVVPLLGGHHGGNLQIGRAHV